MADISRRLVLRGALQALAALVFCNPAFAQSGDPPPPPATEIQAVQPVQQTSGVMGGVLAVNAGTTFLTMNPGGVFGIRQITGKPYSLELESEQTQTLTDGTHISRKVRVNREYRDSLGRTRTEHEPIFPGRSTNTLRLIQIVDPVARVRYMFNTQDRIAHRISVKVMPDIPRDEQHPLGTFRTRPGARAANPSDKPHPESKQEPLGTQTFEGVLAEGVRTTTTLPVGWEGNDRPIETICERWTSTEFKVIIMSKCSDPRSGETTTRLTHAELSDPDPSLFRVPDGYKVVKDKMSRFRRPMARPVSAP